MGKVDEIKELIGWLKVWLGITVAGEFGLIGWFVANYKHEEIYWLVLDIIAILVLAIAIFLINRGAIIKIKELEKL